MAMKSLFSFLVLGSALVSSDLYGGFFDKLGKSLSKSASSAVTTASHIASSTAAQEMEHGALLAAEALLQQSVASSGKAVSEEEDLALDFAQLLISVVNDFADDGKLNSSDAAEEIAGFNRVIDDFAPPAGSSDTKSHDELAAIDTIKLAFSDLVHRTRSAAELIPQISTSLAMFHVEHAASPQDIERNKLIAGIIAGIALMSGQTQVDNSAILALLPGNNAAELAAASLVLTTIEAANAAAASKK